MSSNVRKIADYLEQSGDFTSIISHYATAEINVSLPTWEKARRFVCIRETLKAKVTNENQIALDLPAYDIKLS